MWYCPVYIIHPYRGDGSPGSYERNLAEIKRICQEVREEGLMPVSPVLMLSFMDDTNDFDRAVALEMCEDLLGMVIAIDGGVRVYGDWPSSEGCRREVMQALSCGARVWIGASNEYVAL